MIFYVWSLILLLSVTNWADANQMVERCASFESEDLEARCLEMFLKISMKAKEQLGLDSSVGLKNLDVDGWPPFVSVQKTSWDEMALKDLKEALPFMIFKLRPYGSSKNSEKMTRLDLCRLELRAMLLEKFNEGRGLFQDSFDAIRWKDYHLKGWPRGISSLNGQWTFPELLAIYHSIDGITWEAVKEGETRTVTYTDGTIEELLPKKRGSSAKQTVRKRKGSRSLFKKGKKDIDGQNQASSVRLHESDRSNDENDNTNAKPPFAEVNLKAKAMYKRIKAMAMKQLDLRSLKSLGYLEIEGWPRFVSVRNCAWDELAIKYLERAIHSMNFKSRNNVENSMNSSSPGKHVRRLEIDRVEISALLLKKYNEGKGQQRVLYSYIPWKVCHVKGWPCDVKFDSKKWTYSDILAIYHNIDGITWEPVKDGEVATVTFTDGTIINRAPRKRKMGLENGSESSKRLKMGITDDHSQELDVQEVESEVEKDYRIDEEDESNFFADIFDEIDF